MITRYDESNGNLDKPFRQILQNAGVSQWPKLFQNLRVSCETDWLDWVGPNGEQNSAHVVASWVEPSIKVQNKCHSQVDCHLFEQFNSAVQKVAPPGSPLTCEEGRTGENESLTNSQEASVFPARSRFVSYRRGLKVTRPKFEPATEN